MLTRALLAASASLLAVGCVTPQVRVTAFTDPAFATRAYTRFIVAGLNFQLEDAVQLEQEVCSALTSSGVACAGATKVLPPTRIYTTDEMLQIVRTSGADAVLMVGVVSDSTSENYAGTYAFPMANGAVMAAHVIRRDRGARVGVALRDVATWGNVWSGELIVTGRGPGTSTSAFIAAGSQSIVTELEKAGHVAVPPK
jgi:hypothetical protein